MLIVFSGLPGTGKTTLSRALAKKLGAVYLRIDTIEQAILRSSLNVNSAEEAGYIVSYELAKDNLRIGHNVIADCVNSVEEARAGWFDVAEATNNDIINIQIICSNLQEHRRRVESRKADIEKHKLPTWNDVENIKWGAWSEIPLTIDTAKNTEKECIDIIMGGLKR